MAKKILLIEDEPEVADIYTLSLKQHGFNVITALDGKEGIKLAKKEKPDLVLLDIILPNKDGFSVLKDIKKDKNIKTTPVILLTNLGQAQDQRFAHDLGALDYLVKAQNTPEEVSLKVAKVLT